MMITVYECQKCKHRWVPNIVNPKRCPKCQTRAWSENYIRPYTHSETAGHNQSNAILTNTEFAALKWIAKTHKVAENEILKQTGSPDFIVKKRGVSYEIKPLMGRAVYISERQMKQIRESNPGCKLLVFKDCGEKPIVVVKMSEIVDGKYIDTKDYGQIYIKVTQ